MKLKTECYALLAFDQHYDPMTDVAEQLFDEFAEKTSASGIQGIDPLIGIVDVENSGDVRSALAAHLQKHSGAESLQLEDEAFEGNYWEVRNPQTGNMEVIWYLVYRLLEGEQLVTIPAPNHKLGYVSLIAKMVRVSP